MEEGVTAGPLVSAEAVGALVAFLDTPGLDRRRHGVVNRLRVLQDRGQLTSLPEDLRERVREILTTAEQ